MMSGCQWKMLALGMKRSGYTGHVPGRKWQVGNLPNDEFRTPPSKIASRDSVSSRSRERQPPQNDSRDEVRIRTSQSTQSLANSLRPPSVSSSVRSDQGIQTESDKEERSNGKELILDEKRQQGEHSEGPLDKTSPKIGTGPRDLQTNQPVSFQSPPPVKSGSAQGRSQSLQRRRKDVPKDIFEGMEGGWWSQGEVMRNKERREEAFNSRQPGQSYVTRRGPAAPRDENRVPAPGYSGHMPGLRDTSIGKPFTIAAKESMRKYNELHCCCSDHKEADDGNETANDHSSERN